MKIYGIELTKEKIVIAATIAGCAVILLILAIIFMPLMGKLKMKYAETKALENQIRQSRVFIRSAGKLFGDRVLMTEKDVSIAIDELTEHGKAVGVVFHTIRPRDVVTDKEAQYKILPIELELEAKDEQFANFIGSLDELKNGLIRIRSFDVTPLKDDRAKVVAKMVIDLYLSAREYEE